jgi:hypothetical protein
MQQPFISLKRFATLLSYDCRNMDWNQNLNVCSWIFEYIFWQETVIYPFIQFTKFNIEMCVHSCVCVCVYPGHNEFIATRAYITFQKMRNGHLNRLHFWHIPPFHKNVQSSNFQSHTRKLCWAKSFFFQPCR